LKTDLPIITDVQLAKYLAGEAERDEVMRIEAWLQEHPDNRRYFNQLQLIWQKSNDMAAAQPYDEQQAWDRFSRKLAQRPAVKPMQFTMGWWKIAALLVLALTGIVTYHLVQQARTEKPLQLLAENKTISQTLPDGSTVVLNKHASLTYPSRFNGKERRVILKGEGFFSVTHNAQQPFVVDCETLSVTVVGTAFNIKTGIDSSTVIVEEGKVKVTNNHQSVLLHPGEQVAVDNKSGKMAQTIHTDRLYMYYRNRVFICDATPLWQLVDALNEAYDAHIIIANKQLTNLPISTTFNNEPLDKIMLVIAQTFNATVERKENTILLH